MQSNYRWDGAGEVKKILTSKSFIPVNAQRHKHIKQRFQIYFKVFLLLQTFMFGMIMLFYLTASIAASNTNISDSVQ